MNLKGLIDSHVHAGPDVRTRKVSAYELARAARDAGMRALVLKNHHCSTVPLAAALSEALPGIHVRGGLVLNQAAGGWNAEAVQAALQMGAAEIWMPTLSAENERSFRGFPGTGLRAIDSEGRLLPEVVEIIRLVARSSAMLGTGHLSVEETVAVVTAAREEGVRSILITHPEIQFIAMPVDLQRHLGGPGLYFERCFCRQGFVRDWAGMASDIRAVGPATTILATDLGQPDNAHPVEGLEQFIDAMRGQGLSASDIERITAANPARALGLE